MMDEGSQTQMPKGTALPSSLEDGVGGPATRDTGDPGNGAVRDPEAGNDIAAKPGKVDPESLAIRAPLPRAQRFKKELVIGGASVAALVLAGVTGYALSSHEKDRKEPPANLAQANRKPADDGLDALPSNYGDAAKLGPALPGDLGRPILRAQENKPAREAERAAQEREQARQEKEKQLRKARQSPLLTNVNPAPSSPSEVPASDVQHADEAAGPKMLGSEPSVASGKEGFARQLETRSTRNAHVLEPSASSHVVMAGSVIAASLVTGINSDLPGMVIAQVTRNVFDSITGRVLLIPQGSRLIGNYDSQVTYGQSRALLVWQRLVLPDGRSLRLDNMPASDPQGYAGLEDKLNAHTGRLLKGAAIATLLSVGTELSLSGDSDLVDAIRQGTQGSVSRAGDSITRRNLDVAPTIEVRPGAPVRLLVRQDLVLEPWIKENAQ